MIAASRAALPWRLYAIEALTATGTSLMVAGIFFYTLHQYGWGLKQNFTLAAGQGAVYIVGAMAAGALTRRLGQARLLAIVYLIMALLPLAALGPRHAGPVAVLLLAYSGVSAVGWPIIESMVSTGVSPGELSRRQSMYNLIWSIVGVGAMAIDGSLIEYWPAGVFVVPGLVHAMAAAMLWRGRKLEEAAQRSTVGPEGERRGRITSAVETNVRHDRIDPNCFAPARSSAPAASVSSRASASAPGAPSTSAIDPPSQLLRVRVLALWLSRVALPATYIVIFSLMALMPSLPVMQKLGAARQTLVCSAWMASRTLIFVILGMTIWWHSRPRLLVLAAVIMLAAYFGVTVRPSDLVGHGSPAIDLASMLAWQLVLGAALGLVYSASLYFGMVLSEGSTDHGGYHEALIGVGFVLGPGIGALAQTLRPGSMYAGIVAVGALVGLSVIAVAITSIIGARVNRRRE
ncbi:MAG TPA: MFS transporter [Tepidisphaeraceae bacterium]|nr:MFS transporter [Tepidisphaeraceae bacterium]